MSAIDTDSRSVERLLPLIHAQLCSCPTTTVPCAKPSSSSSSSQPSSSLTTDQAWLKNSFERWTRCLRVFRKLVGSDVIFLVLLFHAGCVWSPNYAALEALLDEQQDIMDGLRRNEESVWALEMLHFIRLFELYESQTLRQDAAGSEGGEDPADEAESEEGPASSARRLETHTPGIDDTGDDDDGFDKNHTEEAVTADKADGNGERKTSVLRPRACPLGHSTLLLEALAGRVVACAVRHKDPITIPKRGAVASHAASRSENASSTPAAHDTHPTFAAAAAAREEVLRQLLVSLADRDETVVQHVATNLIDRWFALIESHPAVALRARRDYSLASVIKFGAYVDSVFGALYEENTHLAAVLVRQSVPSAPLRQLLQTAVPSILCCLLLEEQEFTQSLVAQGNSSNRSNSTATLSVRSVESDERMAEDIAVTPCLVPQAMLLPYNVLGRGSSVAVWLPVGGGPRGGIRGASETNALPASASFSSFSSSSSSSSLSAANVDQTSTPRGQFVSCDVCSDGVLWSTASEMATGTAAGAGLSCMALALRFRPETWWTSAASGSGHTGSLRHLSRAAVTAVFPPAPSLFGQGSCPVDSPVSPHAPASPSSSSSASRGAFEAEWLCAGESTAHSHLRVDAIVPRLLFMSALPLASSLAEASGGAAGTETSKSAPARASASSVSYVSIIEKLVTRCEAGLASSMRSAPLVVRAPSPSTGTARVSSARKRGRAGTHANSNSGSSNSALAAAHPLLHSELDTATYLSFSGSSGLSAAHTVPWWASLLSASTVPHGTPAQPLQSPSDSRAGAVRSPPRRLGRPRSLTHTTPRTPQRGTSTTAHRAESIVTGSEALDLSVATHAVSQLLQRHFQYAHTHMSSTRAASTALRAGMSRDPIAVVAQFLHVTGSRVLALRSLVRGTEQVPGGGVCRPPPPHAHSFPSSPTSSVAEVLTGSGKAGHRVQTSTSSPASNAFGGVPARDEGLSGRGHDVGNSSSSGGGGCLSVQRATSGARALLVVSVASALSLCALVLSHSVMEKELLPQSAMTLWTTEVASSLVDLALVVRDRPQPSLLRAAGIGVCVLPQRPQSLLVMVGLVATVAARQKTALLHHATPSATSPVGASSWWAVLDSTVLKDPTLPGLFFPGTWRLLESATEALKSTAQTLLKREARRGARLGRLDTSAAAASAATASPQSDPASSAAAVDSPPGQDDAVSLAQSPLSASAASPAEAVAMSHGGLLDLAQLRSARLVVPGEPARLATSSSAREDAHYGLWCSPDGTLPHVLETASPAITRSAEEPTTRLTVEVERGPQGVALAQIALQLQQARLDRRRAEAKQRVVPQEGRTRRLLLGSPHRAGNCSRGSTDDTFTTISASSSSSSASGTRHEVGEDTEGSRQLLLRQLQWLWLVTESSTYAPQLK